MPCCWRVSAPSAVTARTSSTPTTCWIPPATCLLQRGGDPRHRYRRSWFVIGDMQVVKPIVFQERRAFDFRHERNQRVHWFSNKFAAGVDGSSWLRPASRRPPSAPRQCWTETNFQKRPRPAGQREESPTALPSAPWPACWSSAERQTRRLTKLIKREFLDSGRAASATTTSDRGQPVPGVTGHLM